MKSDTSHKPGADKARNSQTEWQKAFAQWRDFADKVNAMAKRIDNERHEHGWKLAASVGIPRNGCCLHNASIDDDMRGWCAGNPHRLKVAKQANYLLSQWEATRKAERIINRAWNRLLVPVGACKSNHV